MALPFDTLSNSISCSKKNREIDTCANTGQGTRNCLSALRLFRIWLAIQTGVLLTAAGEDSGRKH